MFSNFKEIYISPSPGDAGGSIGSASAIIIKKLKKPIDVVNYSYLGPEYSNDYISDILNEKMDECAAVAKSFYDYDQNEVYLVPKNKEKRSFFEKLFHFFS